MRRFRKMSRGRSLTLVLALTSFSLASTAAAQPTSGNPLGLLSFEKGKLGWDGVFLGMSLVQAERRVGATLSVDRSDFDCPAYVVYAERNGLQLTLGFPKASPAAKLEWIRIRFEGIQVIASGPELGAALHEVIPAASWIPPKEPAGVIEEEDLMPTYSVQAGKQPLVVRLLPREAMILTSPSCLE